MGVYIAQSLNEMTQSNNTWALTLFKSMQRKHAWIILYDALPEKIKHYNWSLWPNYQPF